MARFSVDFIRNFKYAPGISHEINSKKNWTSIVELRKHIYSKVKNAKTGNGAKIYSTYGSADKITHERKMKSVGAVFCRNGRVFYNKFYTNRKVAYILNSDGTLGRKATDLELYERVTSNRPYGL